MYVYLISLGSISVRFCFSISCMISVHSLSHGSSSAFLYDQFTRPLIWFPTLLSACTQFGLSDSQYFFDLVHRDSDRTGLLKQSIPADLSCIWPVMFSVRIATVLIQRFPFPICTGIHHILYQACPDLSKKCPYHVVERL
jgi:hypothetical protein